MPDEVIVVRHAEIYTKAEPTRSYFIKVLASNVQRVLPEHKVSNKYWRIIVKGDRDKAVEALSHTFGVSSFSPAVELDADVEEIGQEALRLCKQGKSFAVRTQRLDKSFPLTSQQLNELIGEKIVKKKGLKVRLKNPEQQLNIEIFKNRAYVFNTTYPGPGGLPYGTAGAKAVALADDSLGLFAAWMIMRRGLEVTVAGKQDPHKLERWSAGKRIAWHENTDIFKAAEEAGALAVIVPNVNEDLIHSFKYFGKGFPVFVPLAGFSRREAENRMQKVL